MNTQATTPRSPLAAALCLGLAGACSEEEHLHPLPREALILDQVRVWDARRGSAGPTGPVAVVLAGGEVWGRRPAGGPWPADARVLDLPDRVVMPGFIDPHVHLFHSGSPTPVPDTLSDNLRAQLAWGVVGVADLGAPEVIFDLRDRVLEGWLPGPRIRASGPMITVPGSHPCEVVNDRELCRYVGQGPVAEDAATLAEELHRADQLKAVLADAAFTPWPTPRLDPADLAEIVEVAHGSDQAVAVHVDSLDDAQQAAESGVDVLAHPVFSAEVDPAELPDLPVHSTLGAFSGTAALLSGELLEEELQWTPAEVIEAWEDQRPQLPALPPRWEAESEDWESAARANLASAIQSGLRVFPASDAGYWFVPHGLGLHRELEALVELGMGEEEVLAAATRRSALLLDWPQAGLVAPGYRADLVVLSDDPTRDIRATRSIELVLLDGEVHDPESGWPAVQGPGDLCLDDGDCAGDERCDLGAHACAPACDEVLDADEDCGASAVCLPPDPGLPDDEVSDEEPGACRSLPVCDLYQQDCAPEFYGEACVPMDVDTATCWPGGPRQEGEDCSWTDADMACAPGLFCSWSRQRCYALCDPEDPDAPPCDSGSCTRQRTDDGEPWFGLCL